MNTFSRVVVVCSVLFGQAWPAQAVQLLKQSASATVPLGPFVDEIDGVTAEDSLTISQADIRISKNGGAFAQTNNSTGATFMENGVYGVPLDSADTGVLGRLRVEVHEGGAVPVWQDFMVVPANIYDSLAGSDKLQVDAQQIEDGDATEALGTPQTGDAYARIGSNGAGLSAVPWNSAWDSEAQSEAADALNAYDPPTNAEMEARTLAAANYFDPATDEVLANAVKWAGQSTAGTDIALKDSLAKGTDISGFNDPTAAANASAVRTELTDELGRIDVAISSRHAAGAAVSSVTGSVGSISNPASIWDTATSGLTSAGSIGKLFVDNLNAAVSSRATQASVDNLPPQDYFDDLFDGAPTFAEAMNGQGYTSARAEKLDHIAPSLLVSSTIDGTPSSQTEFVLADGPSNDDALNGSLIVITDDSVPAEIKKAVGLVRDYDGDTRTVTLVVDPSGFTIADGNKVDVIATGSPAALWLGSNP
jgi:hypothetical protein